MSFFSCDIIFIEGTENSGVSYKLMQLSSFPERSLKVYFVVL